MSRLIAKSTAGRSLAYSALFALAALGAAGCQPPPAPVAADLTATPPRAEAAASPSSTAVPPTAPGTPLPVSDTAVGPAPTVESPDTPVTTAPVGQPAVISFVAAPKTLKPTESLTLTWQAVGERAELCPVPNFKALSPAACEAVPVSGSRRLELSDAVQPIRYDLNVYAADRSAVASVIACTGTTDWFLADPPDWCAEAPALRSEAAAQRFERGQLIWVAATDELFVFLDGNGFSRIKPVRPRPGSNEDHRVGGAPRGRYEPVRGFGLAWRDELEGVTGLREQLGWAIEPEQAFTTDYQCAMPTSTTVFLDCYLRGPRSVIRISERHVAGSSWEELPER